MNQNLNRNAYDGTVHTYKVLEVDVVASAASACPLRLNEVVIVVMKVIGIGELCRVSGM